MRVRRFLTTLVVSVGLACPVVLSGQSPATAVRVVTPRMVASLPVPVCRPNGDTRIYLRVDNHTDRTRWFNYLLYPQGVFLAWGSKNVFGHRHSRASYDLPAGTSMEVYVFQGPAYTDTAPQLLHTTVTALDCTPNN